MLRIAEIKDNLGSLYFAMKCGLDGLGGGWKTLSRS